jgi:hypothetical protein
VGFLHQARSDRVGSECLNRRCSSTFSIIASGLFLPIIVFIGQLYINLASGVEILDYKLKGYVNHRLRDNQKDSCPYQRRKVLTVIRQQQVSWPHSWWVFIEQSAHERINLFLRQSYTRWEKCQIVIVIIPVFQRQNGKLTIRRLAVGIDHPRALVGIVVPTTKGTDSPKMEFFDTVACLEPGPVELSYMLDQGGQMRVHRWFSPLSLDDWREHKFVPPQRLDVHINQKSFLL